MTVSRCILLRTRNFSDKVVEGIKTHILRAATFSEILTVCEIMWKNMVEPDRPEETI
jgi:hypothetical protein